MRSAKLSFSVFVALYAFFITSAMSATRADMARASLSYKNSDVSAPSVSDQAVVLSGRGVVRNVAAGARTSNTVSARVPRQSAASSIGDENIPAIAASRTVSARAATNAAASAATKTNLEDTTNLLEFTEYCKAQYAQCMDNFCNVLDAERGRCTCSANINGYSKSEDALKSATAALQEVAQKIQYIGLSADEIETLFTQTEAEAKMQSTSDTTRMKNELNKIKKAIVDVATPVASVADSGISMDLSNLIDFSLGNNGADISELVSINSTNSSVKNQRGATLYKTAAARCKSAILNTCTARGVNAALITNAYDLEIDHDCIAYERNLKDSNDQMLATVRRATSVLQKARLLVDQQKNQYDMRGCVAALDTCMQDEFVCGADYEKCLDPTSKYIVDGNVVANSEPGVPGGVWDAGKSTLDKSKSALYMAWNYDGGQKNALFSPGTMAEFIDKNIKNNYGALSTSAQMTDMVGFIQKKIGYIDKRGVANGLCSAVLNRCQNVSYSGDVGDKTYVVDNDVIRSYLAKLLPQLKTRQDSVLAEYAQTCAADVVACLTASDAIWNGVSGYSATGDFSDAAYAACRGHIKTCRSVLSHDDVVSDDIRQWVKDVLGINTSGGTGSGGTGTGDDDTGGSDDDDFDEDIFNNETTYEQDYEKCLSLPNSKISYTGKLCVIYDGNIEANSGADYEYFNNTFVPYMENLAKENGGGYRFPLHRGFVSAYTGRELIYHTGFYVLPSVFRQEAEKCKSMGGVVSGVSKGQITCSYIPNKTEAECNALGKEYGFFSQNQWVGSSAYSRQIYKGEADYYCSYRMDSYYVGDDLFGSKCAPGAIESNYYMQNCICPTGYDWAGECVPHE